MRVHLAIFNYERKEMLQNILYEINIFNKTQGDHTVDYTIVDDGSSYWNELEYCLNHPHTGKKGFWQRWDRTLKYLKQTDYDLYVFLPNDYSEIDFQAIINYGEKHKKEHYAFNLANDGRTCCWNSKQMRCTNSPLVKRVFFTDCGFFTNKISLTKLGWFVDEIPESRFKTPNISSGVGQQLTERMNKHRINMYMPTHSFVTHLDHESTMHPKERLERPLMTERLWILQDKNYALGNFINITPIIKYLYEETGSKVRVYFETQYVQEAYHNDEMIEVLEEKPTSEPYASSSIVCRENTTEDFKYAFNKVIGKPYSDAYKPYITHSDYKIDYVEGDYAVVINGSGSESQAYLDTKDPGSEIYHKAITKLRQNGMKVIFTGSQQDVVRNTSVQLLCDKARWGTIKESIALIQGAKMVIGNDTGLVHAAGTLDKEMLVFWKDTPNIRVRNSGKNTIYSKDWEKDLDQFLKTTKRVIVGIATMDSRHKTLPKVIESLNNQTVVPDQIYIYNNDIMAEDRTDNGKFYPLTKLSGDFYFFSCDDDILYPPTYIEDMIREIEKHQCIVTHHGRILNEVKNNYYTDKHTVFEFDKDALIAGQYLDVAGTGVTAFDTAYFNPKGVFRSNTKRMSDIIFSLKAAEEGKKILLIPHSRKYFKSICDDHENSCLTKEINNNNELRNKLLKQLKNTKL